MSISTRTRFEILKRDGFRCRYCGANAVDVLLHVDHVIARANGGSDDVENLVTACADCNLGKSDVPLDEARIRNGVTAEDALAHALQLRRYLNAQREVQASRDELTQWIIDYWWSTVGNAPHETFAGKLRSVIREHPLSRIVESIDAVAGGASNLYPERQLKYFYGALRRRAERDS